MANPCRLSLFVRTPNARAIRITVMLFVCTLPMG
jgi:hypothetical protein